MRSVLLDVLLVKHVLMSFLVFHYNEDLITILCVSVLFLETLLIRSIRPTRKPSMPLRTLIKLQTTHWVCTATNYMAVLATDGSGPHDLD